MHIKNVVTCYKYCSPDRNDRKWHKNPPDHTPILFIFSRLLTNDYMLFYKHDEENKCSKTCSKRKTNTFKLYLSHMYLGNSIKNKSIWDAFEKIIEKYAFNPPHGCKKGCTPNLNLN